MNESLDNNEALKAEAHRRLAEAQEANIPKISQHSRSIELVDLAMRAINNRHQSSDSPRTETIDETIYRAYGE